MAIRLCDDHEWVGGGNEYCPQCDEAFRCIVPEAATPPTNPEIAQLQARVAELEAAVEAAVLAERAECAAMAEAFKVHGYDFTGNFELHEAIRDRKNLGFGA